jgi:hypothetical protein
MKKAPVETRKNTRDGSILNRVAKRAESKHEASYIAKAGLPQKKQLRLSSIDRLDLRFKFIDARDISSRRNRRLRENIYI